MLQYSELSHMPWRMASLGSDVVVRALWYILTRGIGVDKGKSWIFINRDKHKHNLNKELNTRYLRNFRFKNVKKNKMGETCSSYYS
jgi:hypothetical protein